MSGHVFIVHGGPHGLACDGWVAAPEPHGSTAEAYGRALRQRLAEKASGPPNAGRQRPLVGVTPFAGGRGAPGRVGEGLELLLGSLLGSAADVDYDVVLAAPDAPTFAAAQALRRRLARPDPWPDLGDALRTHADDLAGRAAAGHLALFFGAGVSASAGLPLWDDLLDRLAAGADMAEPEREALRGLNPLDRAAVIEKRFGDPARVQKAIQEIFSTDAYSLTHALLAALPVREVVTTNYDTLFEHAWAAAGREFSVLPNDLRPGVDSWVLKLHGCVRHPESIVLTREDQYGYRGDRAALEGVVQALLITRHMLFVGFSLTDDHFHRVADAVRRVVRQATRGGSEAKPFGTTLVLGRHPMVEELWGADMDWVCPADPTGSGGACATGGGGPDAARELEVFLDYLLSRIPGASYLLDERFASVLTDEERTLRERLLALAREEPRPNGHPSAWGHVDGLLRELGLMERPAVK